MIDIRRLSDGQRLTLRPELPQDRLIMDRLDQAFGDARLEALRLPLRASTTDAMLPAMAGLLERTPRLAVA